MQNWHLKLAGNLQLYIVAVVLFRVRNFEVRMTVDGVNKIPTTVDSICMAESNLNLIGYAPLETWKL
jgi:uncharacterized membrane protein